MQKYKIPTGYLFVDDYSNGKLETLSIGDYGKHHNVKADFLGYDRELNGVPNARCMPLSEKWVVTLSTQYGCTQKCTFCDVPNIPFKGNVSEDDLRRQLYSAISLFPDTKYTERLNVHFARMGEPIYNKAVFSFSRWLAANKGRIRLDTGLRTEVIHPVLTTSFPKQLGAETIKQRILDWCDIKNGAFSGQAGLQFSINSTSDKQRNEMFGGSSLQLVDIAAIASAMPEPLSRKYCLNFAYSTDFEVDAARIDSMFDREKFMVKITPIHNNESCRANGIETVGGYDSWAPYKAPEEAFKSLGWDVLVFVPSFDEEGGLVTCGNAILGGSVLKCGDNDDSAR